MNHTENEFGGLRLKSSETVRLIQHAYSDNASDGKNMSTYRIENIQKATVNGQPVKIFTAYEQQADGAFVHVGQFSAPIKVANKNLREHIAL